MGLIEDYPAESARSGLLESDMRFRSVLFLLFPVFLLWVSAASAQKRVFATVNPNTGVFNNSADLYDPLTGVISPVVQPMQVARERHIALRLANGKILIAGGYNNHYLKSAELYNPANGMFTATGDLFSTRGDSTAVILPNGEALVAGGYNGTYLKTAETYNPTTEIFSFVTSPMTIARQNPGMVLMADGNVLITGGFSGSFLANAEVFDSLSRTFAATGVMRVSRTGHTSTLLADGKVLITGGCNNSQTSENVCNNFLDSAEVYDPATKSFTQINSMNAARKGHTTVRLPNGNVLISGGMNSTGPLNSSEIYNPTTGVFTTTGSMATPRMGHTASILSNGKILIAGGKSDQYLNSAEVYDAATGIYSTVASTLAVPRFQQTATVLGNGKVLIAGGRNQDPLMFEVSTQSLSDNIAPNIVFSPYTQLGYVPYAGSGVVLVFSPVTGEVIDRIVTGGKPAWITPFANGQKLAAVSVLDNRVFIIDTNTRSLQATYSFTGSFGFGSRIEISPDESAGYVSSTATGAVIKFNLATGSELGRLQSLRAPAQITATKDGRTLLIVDTTANQVIIADAASMTQKSVMNPVPKYSITNFTIFSRAVLNADESGAIITSQDSNSVVSLSAAFIFNPSTGALIDIGNGQDGIYGVGYQPSYTMLEPNGEHWLVLSQNYLSLVPTVLSNPNNGDSNAVVVQHYSIGNGAPLGSANIVLSPDSRYAFYASATTDMVLQHDIKTGGVIGSYPVGDIPNLSADQASSVAIAPDESTLAVVNLTSNELDLLSNATVFRQTKFISQQDKFTGLSLVNLANVPADIKVTAMDDGGVEYTTLETQSDLVNPVTLQLAPNAQKSVDISLLFNLNNDISNSGYLVIESTQPILVGHSATGQIQSDFLEAYIRNMQGVPLQPYTQQLHDWILPEIPQARGSSAEINFVNPNYNASDYAITHHGTDGTELETKSEQTLGASQRTTKAITDLVSSITKGLVLITGGFSSTNTKTLGSAEMFDAITLSYFSALGQPKVPRQGHTSVVLKNGKAFIAGGKNGFTILRSAEIFTPGSRVFAFTPGSMNIERYRHTATLLGNGTVLLAGGQNSISINKTAELYDPVADKFSYTAGPMNVVRDAHTATRLSDGRVLLVGGLDGVAASSTAEIYDPVTKTFTMTGSLHFPRAFHTAVLLDDGSVLIAGGFNGSYLDSAELYDPQTGVFSLASSMTTARSNHTATLLSTGMVLIAGGKNSDTALTGGLNTAELYDPLRGEFVQTVNNMTAYRSAHTATLLLDDPNGNNDRVIISGGYGSLVNTDDTTSAIQALSVGDMYTPETGLFTRMTSLMSTGRQGHSAVLLAEGVSAGYLRGKSNVGLLSAEFYDDGGATTAIHGIDMDKYIGITTIYSPRFVLSSDRVTLLNIINGNKDGDAVVTLNLYASNGSPLATKTFTLSRSAQMKGSLLDFFPNDTNLLGQEGWLEVSSTVDQIVGTVSFTNLNNKYLAGFELSASPMSNFVFPLISEDADFLTEISLLNSGTQTATVQIELWGLEGTLDASKIITLDPQTQLSQTLGEMFPGMQPHLSGNVRIHSSQPIYGMGELSARNLRFVSSVPPVAYPEQ